MPGGTDLVIRKQQWFETKADGQAVMMTRTGGRDYEAKIVANCRLCNSPYRTEVENALLKSYSYVSIERALPEDAKISWKNIRNHYKNGHMPIEESMKRALIESDAQDRGLDVEAYEQALANHVTLAKLGVQKTMDRMMSGEIKPDISDGIAFARLLAQVESQAGTDTGFDVTTLTAGFAVYMEAMSQVCTREQMDEIVGRINSNPVMASLLRRHEAPAGLPE